MIEIEPDAGLTVRLLCDANAADGPEIDDVAPLIPEERQRIALNTQAAMAVLHEDRQCMSAESVGIAVKYQGAP